MFNLEICANYEVLISARLFELQFRLIIDLRIFQTAEWFLLLVKCKLKIKFKTQKSINDGMSGRQDFNFVIDLNMIFTSSRLQGQKIELNEYYRQNGGVSQKVKVCNDSMSK